MMTTYDMILILLLLLLCYYYYYCYYCCSIADSVLDSLLGFSIGSNNIAVRIAAIAIAATAAYLRFMHLCQTCNKLCCLC